MDITCGCHDVNNAKVYVDVDASFDRDGLMLPRAIKWEDGSVYEIDRVTGIRQAPAEKAGGQGDRYTVMIGGKQTYLFFERDPEIAGPIVGRWFVERRVVRTEGKNYEMSAMRQ